jgi:hypothetical protein
MTLDSNAENCNFARQPWSSIVTLKGVASELDPKLNEWLNPSQLRLPEPQIEKWKKALADLLLEDYHQYKPLMFPTDLKKFVSRGIINYKI